MLLALEETPGKVTALCLNPGVRQKECKASAWNHMLKWEKTRTLLFENLYSPSFALCVARFLWFLIEDDDNVYGKKAEFWYGILDFATFRCSFNSFTVPTT